MGKKSPRLLALLVASMIVVTTTAGCQNTSSKSSNTGKIDSSKTMTLDIFDSFANFSGEQTGWFAKIVKDKFNIKLNIIHDTGDQLFQTRSAAGNLGDIVAIGQDKLQNTIKAGLLLDMKKDNLLDNYGKDIKNYPTAIKKFQTAYNTGNAVYALPNSVSNQSPTTPSETGDLTFGVFVPWELYTAIGSPKLNSVDDILPTLKAMHDKQPKSSDGKKTYAFSLFKDWDGGGMTLAQQMGSMYGRATESFLEYSAADMTQTTSWLDPNSYYMKSLKMYYQANQEGLLDPDSATQNWDTMSGKYTNGQILFSWWSFLGKPTYNTTANKNAGKGYMFVPINDEKLLSQGNTPAGGTYAIGIGSKCQDPARVMQFINWLYSPDYQENSIGPKGLVWNMKNGKAVLTDFGMNAVSSDGSTIQVPAEYGGGSFKDGTQQINFGPISWNDIDPNTKEPYNYNQWSSYETATNNKLQKSWSEAVGGAKDTVDYLKKKNQLSVLTGTDYVQQTPEDSIKAIEDQCKTVVKDYSWKMVFAKSQSEFDKLYNEMVKQANGFGIQKVDDFYKADLAKHQKAIKDTLKSLSK